MDEPKRPARREFLLSASKSAAAGLVLGTGLIHAEERRPDTPKTSLAEGHVPVSLIVNGESRTILVEPRLTLLDALREELALTGTKKGCDRGECGACTVHVDGRRIVSCMALAVMQDGKRITTIEGLEKNVQLHAVQSAFIEHDGFQCGFCTSGQIMSGVAMIEEVKAGWPSAVTSDVARQFTPHDLTKAEIRERLSGNLCRCACYPNIVDAIANAVQRG